jgi:hypothetical protein
VPHTMDGAVMNLEGRCAVGCAASVSMISLNCALLSSLDSSTPPSLESSSSVLLPLPLALPLPSLPSSSLLVLAPRLSTWPLSCCAFIGRKPLTLRSRVPLAVDFRRPLTRLLKAAARRASSSLFICSLCSSLSSSAVSSARACCGCGEGVCCADGAGLTAEPPDAMPGPDPLWCI